MLLAVTPLPSPLTTPPAGTGGRPGGVAAGGGACGARAAGPPPHAAGPPAPRPPRPARTCDQHILHGEAGRALAPPCTARAVAAFSRRGPKQTLWGRAGRGSGVRWAAGGRRARSCEGPRPRAAPAAARRPPPPLHGRCARRVPLASAATCCSLACGTRDQRGGQAWPPLPLPPLPRAHRIPPPVQGRRSQTDCSSLSNLPHAGRCPSPARHLPQVALQPALQAHAACAAPAAAAAPLPMPRRSPAAAASAAAAAHLPAAPFFFHIHLALSSRGCTGMVEQ